MGRASGQVCCFGGSLRGYLGDGIILHGTWFQGPAEKRKGSLGSSWRQDPSHSRAPPRTRLLSAGSWSQRSVWRGSVRAGLQIIVLLTLRSQIWKPLSAHSQNTRGTLSLSPSCAGCREQLGARLRPRCPQRAHCAQQTPASGRFSPPSDGADNVLLTTSRPEAQ